MASMQQACNKLVRPCARKWVWSIKWVWLCMVRVQSLHTSSRVSSKGQLTDLFSWLQVYNLMLRGMVIRGLYSLCSAAIICTQVVQEDQNSL